MPREKTVIEVRAADTNEFKYNIFRVPKCRVGYQLVRYHGKDYQLYGGIRTNLHIRYGRGMLGQEAHKWSKG